MSQNVYDDPAFGPAQVAAHPEWTDELHRPPFLLVSARI
jgi:hypothetical protein